MSEKSLKLIYGAKESKECFYKALENTQDTLIMVCPWVRDKVFNLEIMNRVLGLLHNGKRVCLGWGYTYELLYPKKSNEIISLENFKNKNKKALYWLQILSELYSNFEWRFIGTHEKYLVCDKKFAMIGSHNFLSSKDNNNSVKEIGIYTTDLYIIEDLIINYNNSDTIIEFEKIDNEFAKYFIDGNTISQVFYELLEL